MKKFWFSLIIFFLPIIVYASSINYDITNFLIDANIETNGDLSVKELIVLDGNFNGYIRELQYKNLKLDTYTPGNINFSNSAIYNAEGISNVKLATKKMRTNEINFDTFNETFTPLTRVNNDKLAQNGNYFFRTDDNTLSFKMYQKADDEIIAFLIIYTVDKAVVIHNDIAELYWTFIGNGFTDKIYNLKIRVNVPNYSYPDFYFWAHGDITGEIDKISSSSVLAQMKSVDKNSVIDLRILFDKNWLDQTNSLRDSKEDALLKIRAIEEERAESVNKQRELIRALVKIAKIGTNCYYIILILLWIYIYWKFDKEYKSDFYSKYYREFTGEYNVEVIDYLMNYNITPNAMSASIMNLIYKKNIRIEEISKDKKKQYRFHYLNNENVNDTEQILLDFLFEQVGKNGEFTTNDLEKYAKSTKTCESFSKHYTEWKNCVKKDAEKEQFYETNGIPVVIGILVLLVTILLFMVVIYYHIDYIPSYFLLPVSIIFLIYTIVIKKRTIKGNEHYLRWKAFKNFLADFGNFKIKELPEITLWEKYLVYATVFGLASEVEKSMNVKIAEYPDTHIDALNSWNPYINFQVFQAVNHSVNNAVVSSIRATTANANSRNSSGSGLSGGGFSGGAGFGGGGGGGHGF